MSSSSTHISYKARPIHHNTPWRLLPAVNLPHFPWTYSQVHWRSFSQHLIECLVCLSPTNIITERSLQNLVLAVILRDDLNFICWALLAVDNFDLQVDSYRPHLMTFLRGVTDGTSLPGFPSFTKHPLAFSWYALEVEEGVAYFLVASYGPALNFPCQNDNTLLLHTHIAGLVYWNGDIRSYFPDKVLVFFC